MSQQLDHLNEVNDSELTELLSFVENASDSEIKEIEDSAHRLDNGDVVIHFNPSRRNFLKSLFASSMLGAAWVLTPQKARAFFNVLMMRKKSTAAVASAEVFSAYAYTGTGAAQTINNDIALTSVATGGTSVGQQAYTTPGTYSWTCPNGVSSVSVVCVGGGGGPNGSSYGGGCGGGLGWKNNISVVPGVSYTVVVGTGGGSNTAGGDSYFLSSLTVKGGGGAANSSSGGGTYLGDGGGNGGTGGIYGGGGGAGGYSGNGGNTTGSMPGTAGAGGGGGGGGASGYSGGGAGGGGVGILGQGANGSGGAGATNYGTPIGGGGGGSGGVAAASTADGSPGTSGGNYGGGAGSSAGGGGGTGASGAVRIIWGAGRSFPSTLTADQTVVNNNDATVTQGAGLVWIKNRSGANENLLFDTNRIGQNWLQTNSTAAATTDAGYHISSFNNNGFSLQGAGNGTNASGSRYISWTFKKATKFFDIVTYSGDGNANRQLSHSLGVTPGMWLIKRTDATGDWIVRYNGDGSQSLFALKLNSSAAKYQTATANYLTSSTQFWVGDGGWGDGSNINGASYTAYLFAHDPSGSGMIKCGFMTLDGSGNATVNLGWEPQFLHYKAVNSIQDWFHADVIRGLNYGGFSYLNPNLTSAEQSAAGAYFYPTATGFKINSFSLTNNLYLYVAIRRSTKAPTVGTDVFMPIASSATTGTKLSTNFPVDLQIFSMRTGGTNKNMFVDRVRGFSSNGTESGAQLLSNSSVAETTNSIPSLGWDSQGFQMPSSYSGASMVFWNFKRAPGVFEIVGFISDASSNYTGSHGLGTTPELVILKAKGASSHWRTWASSLTSNQCVNLNQTNAAIDSGSPWIANNSTTLTFQNSALVASTYHVAYLFATKAGISKVGSYTGTGSTMTINCGFSTPARFVMIKRTDSTSEWYVWDSARGINAATDPTLYLNNSTAEWTLNDTIDTDPTGFVINTDSANVNVSAATYIYLAFA